MNITYAHAPYEESQIMELINAMVGRKHRLVIEIDCECVKLNYLMRWFDKGWDRELSSIITASALSGSGAASAWTLWKALAELAMKVEAQDATI